MILDKITLKTRKRVAALKKRIPAQELQQKAASLAEPAGDFPFYQALKQPGMSVICEVKKASPSKGVIAEDFDYLQIAKDYQSAGADALSVLTEPDFFQGSIDYLQEIKQNVSIPILMKDFIIDSYQIYLARVIGADAVLLICSLLDRATLSAYLELCKKLQLSALVETHDADEVQKALAADAKIIGVNNRNLHTFEVDFQNSLRLRELVPAHIPFVAESGIRTRDDFKALEQANVSAVLIGETLMRSENKRQALSGLRGQA